MADEAEIMCKQVLGACMHGWMGSSHHVEVGWKMDHILAG